MIALARQSAERKTQRRFSSLERQESVYSPCRVNFKSLLKTTKALFRRPENQPISRMEFERLKVAELVCGILALIGFSCGTLAYDQSVNDSLYENAQPELSILLCLSSLSTALLLLAIVWRTKRTLKWEQAKGYIDPLASVRTSGKNQVLVAELLVNAVHPFYSPSRLVFTNTSNTFEYEVEYSLIGFLTVLMFLRLYHLVRVVALYSPFMNDRSQRLCSINGIRTNLVYAAKCYFTKYPFRTVSSLLVLGVLVSGFCLRVFERPLDEVSGSVFADYGNTFWCIVVTMTTVGYGDYFPNTVFGRLVGFLACIYGVFVLSLAMVLLNNTLALESSEQKSLAILKRLEYKQELRQGAARLISEFAVCIRQLDQGQFSPAQQLSFWQALQAFKNLRLRTRLFYNFDCLEERLETNLLDVMELFDRLRPKQAEITRILEYLEN